MSIEGIDRIVHGVEDLAVCRKFFLDWGLKLVREDANGLDFETLNGCEVMIRKADDPSLPPAVERGSTLRQVIWGVHSESTLAALGKTPAVDPTGIGLGFRVSRKRPVEIAGTPSNVWGHAARIDHPSPVYDRAEPVEVGHVVFFTDALEETSAFYQRLGFHLSDRYPGRGHFLRCSPCGGHHDLFLLQTPEAKRGLNHVAFTVRDLHEVVGGGLNMSRHGWETQIGPGRHPISSALFWYVKSPAGGLAEYFADEDVLTEKWQPRDFQPSPAMFAEWAVTGGIDGTSRRQKGG